MADRFPLIANPSTRQIEELSVADNLNLTGNSIVGLSTISTNTLTVNTVTGTALSFTGNVTGATASFSSYGNVTGTTASFSGNVSIGGTLTYEDVTNVDSVGIITARSGVDFSSLLREGVNITAGKLSDNTNIELSNGMVHLFTTTETTTSTPNIILDASTSLNSKMGIGEAITVVIIVTAAAAGYSAQLTIDGSAVTEEWLGGSAPSEGGSGGYDVYNHHIIKTADATYVVLSNLVNYA